MKQNRRQLSRKRILKKELTPALWVYSPRKEKPVRKSRRLRRRAKLLKSLLESEFAIKMLAQLSIALLGWSLLLALYLLSALLG